MVRSNVAVIALAATLWAAPARADWLYTAFTGATTTSSVRSLSRATSPVFGGTVGWMSAQRSIGVEVDFGFSRDFFEPTADGDVRTITVNLVGGIPLRPLLLYTTGGLGLIRHKAERGGAVADESNLGADVGGGALLFLTRHLGIRGDLRYFKDLQRDAGDRSIALGGGTLSFWRGAVGVALRF